MDDSEIIQEFLVESAENLTRLDQEMVQLERQPGDQELLASIFRAIHTVKGTCGFLGFGRLESLAHVTENILGQLRAGERSLDGPLTSLILEAVDAIKRILDSIGRGEGEGDRFEDELLARLREVGASATGKPSPAKAVPTQPPPPLPEPAPIPVSAPPEAEPPHEQGTAPKNSPVDSTVRIDVSVLDRLMNLVGELVLTRNQVLQYNAALEDGNLSQISQRLNLITTELQEGVMKTRMQPIGTVWNKLPRVVRDLAAQIGKQIELTMEGADTELDRTLIEAIKDPIVHLVRNACDHGIEDPDLRVSRGKTPRGRLALRAYHEGGKVILEITDDGGGMDAVRLRTIAVERGLITRDKAMALNDSEAMQLIFLPGFSTAREVTNISGRGVGMDVVRTHVERVGGSVELVSHLGAGTSVRVKLPLTLAIIPGLVVLSGGEHFVIPQVALEELVRFEGEAANRAIEYIQSTPVLRRRDRLLPMVDLAEVLNIPSQRPPDVLSIVVVRIEKQRFGLIVDEIGDAFEIVVKPLGKQLKSLNCYAGATIMGDGKVALILDVAGVAARSAVLRGSDERELNARPEAAAETKRLLLLFRAGNYTRLAIPLSRVSRLEEIPRERVEMAAGRAVVQYRDRLLPLIPVAEMLGSSSGEGDETLRVIVFRAGDHDLGLVVDEIHDIVDEAVHSPCATDRPGLLGSAVVGGRVTDFLDLDAAGDWVAMAQDASLAKLEAVLSGGCDAQVALGVS